MLNSTSLSSSPLRKILIVEAIIGALPQAWILFLIYKSFHFQLIPEIMTLALITFSLIGLIGFMLLAFSVSNRSTLNQPFLTFLMVTMGCTLSIWWLIGSVTQFSLWSLFGVLQVLVTGHFAFLYLKTNNLQIQPPRQDETKPKPDNETSNIDETKYRTIERIKAWNLPILTIGIIAIAAKLFEIYGYFSFRTNQNFFLQSLHTINGIILFGYFIAIVAVTGKASKLRIALAVLIFVVILFLMLFLEAIKAH